MNLPLVALATAVWAWLHRLGGPGLILLGLIDNSAIPVPGSVDVLLILLCAHHRPWWLYYACMATIGGVVGGYVTYRLAEKGGQEPFEKRIGKERAQALYARFARGGFVSVALGAILPPPFPMLPVLLAAGAMQYPRRKFLAAIATGRGLRYCGLAYLARVYGKVILDWLTRYYRLLFYSLLIMAVLGAVAGLVYWWTRRRRRRPEEWRQRAA